MTYGVIMDVPAPVQAYDAVHAEILRRGGGSTEGLLLHVTRPTEEGFQILEVWESRERFLRFAEEVAGPVTAELSGGAPPPGAAPVAREFEVRGLVIPQGGVAH